MKIKWLYILACLTGLMFMFAGCKEKDEAAVIYEAGSEETKNTEWKITQYAGNSGLNSMFYTIQGNNGGLIIVDGGWEEDEAFVREIIAKQGNEIDAWILTHPHQDHIGAFCRIYSEPDDIRIKKIYAVDMAPPELCLEKAPWDSTEIYEKFLNIDIPELEYVHKGDILQITGLTVEIMNAYDDYVEERSKDLLNDGSMLFRIKGNKESMLFCADVGKSMNEYLLEEYGDTLKADYIQMGHHGNGGLRKNFYRKVQPRAAFFDAPDWLLNDTTGKYNTPAKVKLMKGMGSEVLSFITSPNEITLY